MQRHGSRLNRVSQTCTQSSPLSSSTPASPTTTPPPSSLCPRRCTHTRAVQPRVVRLVSKDARELYRQITRHPPPPFDLEVILTVPSLAPNEALVYLPPSSDSLFRPPRAVSLSGATNTSVTPPPYTHGMALFCSIYILLLSLPAWSLYKRIRRRSGRAAAMSFSLRLQPPTSTASALVFHQQPSPTMAPFPTLSQNIPPVQLHSGTLTFSVTYIATPFFEIDELESVLSSRFRSAEAYHGLEECFVPTLATTTATTRSSLSSQPSRSPPSVPRTSTPAHTRPIQNESIAERFILPSKQSNISSSPQDPLARIRKESISVNNPNCSPSPTTSPRQCKLSLNSSSPSSSIVSQGPFLTNSTTMGVGFPLAGGGTTAPNTATAPLPIRRPNLNPFKSNTISIPSSSYPSVSLCTGPGPGPGSNPAPPLSPLASHAPPLIGPATITTGGQPSA